MIWFECNGNREVSQDIETNWRDNLALFVSEHRPIRVQNINKGGKVDTLPFDTGIKPVKTTKQLQRKYKNLCWRLTNRNAPLIPDIHLRKFRGGYHIDHIIPISYGFRHNINPHYIASLDNLRMIPERDNLNKGVKLTNEAKEILIRWELLSQ